MFSATQSLISVYIIGIRLKSHKINCKGKLN